MSVKETQQNMSKAEDRARAQARREADEKFYGEFERYMMDCFQKPGFKLESEQQLAVRFGVTRYKVRKAIERLNQAGVLTRKKHGGSGVTKVTSGASLSRSICSSRWPAIPMRNMPTPLNGCSAVLSLRSARG